MRTRLKIVGEKKNGRGKVDSKLKSLPEQKWRHLEDNNVAKRKSRALEIQKARSHRETAETEDNVEKITRHPGTLSPNP